MRSLEEAQKVCPLATWEVSPLGEMVSCTSSGKGGKKREFIGLDFSHLPLVKCYPRSTNSSTFLGCWWLPEVPDPMSCGGIPSKSGNDGRRQTLGMRLVSAGENLILYIRCVDNSPVLLFFYQKREPGITIKDLSQSHMASKW